MRLGVLGGTFDPIHDAHLKVASAVRERLELAEVLFVPAGKPWRKLERGITAAEHRVEMVRLAVNGQPYFKLSMIEVERSGPSYTADTIAGLRRQLEEKDEVFFILGWDSLADLPRWHEPARLAGMAKLVGVNRPGVRAPDLALLERAIPGISKRVVLMEEPAIDISSSDIRQRVARGEPIHGLVPDAVERYIKRHRLYSGAQGAPESSSTASG